MGIGRAHLLDIPIPHELPIPKPHQVTSYLTLWPMRSHLIPHQGTSYLIRLRRPYRNHKPHLPTSVYVYVCMRVWVKRGCVWSESVGGARVGVEARVWRLGWCYRHRSGRRKETCPQRSRTACRSCSACPCSASAPSCLCGWQRLCLTRCHGTYLIWSLNSKLVQLLGNLYGTFLFLSGSYVFKNHFSFWLRLVHINKVSFLFLFLRELWLENPGWVDE
jgi:hypothetical protein